MHHRKISVYCYINIFVIIALTSVSFDTLADEFHYNSILIGDRAAGLAGAYVAISDDPSGLFYNPAGIVHAATNNISGSMNAVHSTETIYKNAIGSNTDWIRNSNELLPNFFGVLQDFGGGKAGFSYAVVDSVLENQDQDFNNVAGANGPINNYAINFNNQDKTIYFGPSYAITVNDDTSIGFTLYGHYREKEQILHQYLDISSGNFEESSSYYSVDEIGIRPVLGIMYSPAERVSLGFTIAKTNILSSTSRVQSTLTEVSNSTVINNGRTNVENDGKRNLPLTMSTGLAIFLSDSLLVSGDLVFQEAHDDRISVLNFSIGSEFYVSPTWAMRGGIFSNLANTPELSTNNLPPGSIQLEHIDYIGIALSASRFSTNNTLSMGINLSRGTGEAQLFPTAASGVPQLQSVSSTIMTIFLSATYSY